MIVKSYVATKYGFIGDLKEGSWFTDRFWEAQVFDTSSEAYGYAIAVNLYEDEFTILREV